MSLLFDFPPAFVFGFPELNASLNALSGVLIVIAYIFIRRGQWYAHACTMIAATTVSAAFLVCYVTYHAMHGEKTTRGGDWLHLLYFIVLIPHLLLAMVVLPMIATTVWRAAHRRWPAHRKLAVPTFWLWLYVSSTGVIVYFMLYHTRLSQ